MGGAPMGGAPMGAAPMGAPGLPPMPGAGGLPPMPGAGGPGGLPPMPGAGRPAALPLGTKMQPLTTVPQGPQRADALLHGIMAGMQQFETIAPKFMQMMQQPPPGLTPQEQQLLTGQPSQQLHERFLRLQQNAQSFTQGQPMTPAFTAEIESFYTDMYSFME